jgi:hypothetical protein
MLDFRIVGLMRSLNVRSVAHSKALSCTMAMINMRMSAPIRKVIIPFSPHEYHARLDLNWLAGYEDGIRQMGNTVKDKVFYMEVFLFFKQNASTFCACPHAFTFFRVLMIVPVSSMSIVVLMTHCDVFPYNVFSHHAPHALWRLRSISVMRGNGSP